MEAVFLHTTTFLWCWCVLFSPGVGVDYWIWALQISGIGTTLTGINFFVTILKMRTKGMTLFRMPIFTWTSLCADVLIIASFPILPATIALLTLDRYFGMHFFTNDFGGNMMMYVNLIWAWGHPEVYILILPISLSPRVSLSPSIFLSYLVSVSELL